MRERPNPPLRARDVVWISWSGPRRRDPYRTPWWLHLVTAVVLLGTVVALAKVGWSKTAALAGTTAAVLVAQGLCGWLLMLWYGPEPEGAAPAAAPAPEVRRDRPTVSLVPPELRDEYDADQRAAEERWAARRAADAEARPEGTDPPSAGPGRDA